MLARVDASFGAIVLAFLVERWAEEVLRWDPRTSEPWSAFVDRHHVAEKALEDKVQHLPGCRLSMDATGREVSLSRGGTPRAVPRGTGRRLPGLGSGSTAARGTLFLRSGLPSPMCT